MAKIKTIKHYCDSCEVEFTIKAETKLPISYCPFCGEEVLLSDNDRPVLNSFDSLDEYDNDIDDYEYDSEEDYEE